MLGDIIKPRIMINKTCSVIFTFTALLVFPAIAHTQNWGFSGSIGAVFGNLMPLETYMPEFHKALVPGVQPELCAGFMYHDPEKSDFPELGFAQFGVRYLVPSKQNFDFVNGAGGYPVSKGTVTASAIQVSAGGALVLPLSTNPLNHYYIGYSAAAGIQQYNLSDTLINGVNYFNDVMIPGKQKDVVLSSGLFISGVFETERFRYFGMAEMGSSIGLPTHIYVLIRGGIMIPFKQNK